MAQPAATSLSAVAATTTKICDLDCDSYQFGDNGRDVRNVVTTTRLKLTTYNGGGVVIDFISRSGVMWTQLWE